MTTNSYFNKIKSNKEQNLYEALVVENIQIAGYNVFYIPRNISKMDEILVEPQQSIFEKSYTIECIIQTLETWDGPGDIMSKFGLRTQDFTTLVLSKKRFRELKIPNRQIRPFEGDLIYIGEDYSTFPNIMLEINHVKQDTPFWPLGKNFVYSLVCNAYNKTYDELLFTGVPVIDNINELSRDEKNTSIYTDFKGSNVELQKNKPTLLDFSEKNVFGNL